MPRNRLSAGKLSRGEHPDASLGPKLDYAIGTSFTDPPFVGWGEERGEKSVERYFFVLPYSWSAFFDLTLFF